MTFIRQLRNNSLSLCNCLKFESRHYADFLSRELSIEPWPVQSRAQNVRNETTHNFFARSTNQALAMPASTVSLKKSTGTKGATAAEPPPPPAGYTYPADFRFKRCRRCGVWNCSPAPYDQSAGPEHLWGLVVAWEGGSVYAPTGSHCLLCRKARTGMVS